MRPRGDKALGLGVQGPREVCLGSSPVGENLSVFCCKFGLGVQEGAAERDALHVGAPPASGLRPCIRSELQARLLLAS